MDTDTGEIDEQAHRTGEQTNRQMDTLAGTLTAIHMDKRRMRINTQENN